MSPVIRPITFAAAMLAAVSAVGCRGADTPAVASFQTVTDTVGDTIVVRTVGAVDSAITHTLVPELSIGRIDGADEYVFGSVDDVIPTADGGAYVWDGQANAMRQYDSTGAFVRQVGRKGGGPGEYDDPIGMDLLPDGRLAIWDARHQRVNVYDTAGTFVTSWRAATNFFLQRGLTADSGGNIYLQMPLEPNDPQNPMASRPQGVVRFAADGTTLDSLAPPALAEPATLSITMERGGKMIGMSRYTINYSPYGMWRLSPYGYLVSANGDRYAVTLHRPGHPVRIEREVPSVPVDDAERQQIRNRLTQQIQRGSPGWSWNGPPVPSVKPPVAGLTVDADGRVWVARSLPSVKRPPADDDTTNTPRWSSPVAYDVYAPDGRLLGYVPVPSRTEIMRAHGDAVWGTVRDSLDVETVVRFRVQPSLGQ